MNDNVGELKLKCSKIAAYFKQEADELETKAWGLSETARFIEYAIETGNASSMQNLVKIHSEVLEGSE